MERAGPWGIDFPRSFSDALTLGPPAIVANDAGAAAHIAAWLSSDDTERNGPAVFARGPAARILSPRPLKMGHDLGTTLSIREWALVGTGWQSRMEQDAMRICAERGIPCVAVVDHWVNYSRRFESLRAEERPVVVVTDLIALELARAELSGFSTHKWPNDLLTQFITRVAFLTDRDASARTAIPTLLWINEPIDNGSIAVDPLAETSFRRELVHLLQAIAVERQIERIVLRQHPSLPSFPPPRQSIHFENHVEIEYSPMGTPLEADVARASLVLGLSSYALFLSSGAGRETYSAASALGVPSRLPTGLVSSWPARGEAVDR